MNFTEIRKNIAVKSKFLFGFFYSKKYLIFAFLLLIKTLLQMSLFQNGYQWLSADDFCRTVKSFEWLQNPEIHSGVWLSGHFWLNGFAMLFVKNLFLSATLVNLILSAFTLIYFYNVIEICFDKKIAFFSSLIFCVFPFQVWLSISGLPESIFFFFVIAGIYYFIKWKISDYKTVFLIFSSAAFALSNLFRYEGWLFSVVLVFFVALDFRKIEFKKEFIKNVAISSVSLTTIIFWLVLNYIDYKDVFYFAKETNKIYEDYNTVKYLQRLIQYPTFLFYIAPITTVLSVKVAWDFVKSVFKPNGKFSKIAVYFAMFNIVELSLLMIQGLAGTGGTNIISRYIVINALLFLPFAVYQVFQYRKLLTSLLLIAIILVNYIWCYYFPQSFRADTIETGALLKNQIEKNFNKDEKIYFEEIEGYYDIFAVQTLSNNPSRFVLGNFPSIKTEEKKSKKKKKQMSPEELNILDIKSFFEKNKISLAVVKSDSYVDKLRKMNLKNEEIGEYKIFYLKNFESNLNDSTISIFSSNVPPLDKNSDLVNFNKTLALKDVKIDNSNFGFNPQTITLEWVAVNKNIIDSIDYENFDFDRYNAVININTVDNDSVVYTESKRIFSDRNIEDLIFYNSIKNIIVLKPFAVIFYSKRMSNYSFESGVYNMSLKVYDSKAKKDMVLYKGNSRFKSEDESATDTLGNKSVDSVKTKTKETNLKRDSIIYSYNLGSIIAMFPNTNIEKLVKKTNVNFYRIITQNGLQVFFSQRYQGDNFLNFVFNYF